MLFWQLAIFSELWIYILFGIAIVNWIISLGSIICHVYIDHDYNEWILSSENFFFFNKGNFAVCNSNLTSSLRIWKFQPANYAEPSDIIQFTIAIPNQI
jgi:hypothetical protein